MKHLIFSCLLVIFVLSLQIALAAPGLITYQGRLQDDAGRPVTTAVDVTFTFWNAESGGSQLGSGFSDTDTVTPSAAGVYSTMIGDDPGNLVPASVFTGDSVWLNVNVGGEDLSPRKRITSVGYAVQASHAETAGDAFSVKKVVRDFVVASGKSVDAGDVVTFLSGVIAKHGPLEEITQSDFNKGDTWDISTARLSDTSFIIAYSDHDNADYGTVNIGTITDTTISWQGEDVFNEGKTDNISIASFSGTEWIVAYQDDDNGKKGTVRIGEISGGGIAWEEETVFNDAITDIISVAAMNATDFIVAYRDQGHSNYGIIRCGRVAPASLSWGNELTFNSDSTAGINIVRLSDETFALTFKTNLKGYAGIGRKYNLSLNFGPEWEFYPGDLNYISLTALSENAIAVAYNYINGMARVGTISGRGVFWGPQTMFSQGQTKYISISALSDSRFVLAYGRDDNDYFGEMRLGTVSGNQCAVGPKVIFSTASVMFGSSAALADVNFVLGYGHNTRPETGVALVGKAYGTVIGIADAAGIGGSSVPVILEGISDHHTGLETGKMYYAGEDGTLIEDPNAPRIGRALSDTELLLDVQR